MSRPDQDQTPEAATVPDSAQDTTLIDCDVHLSRAIPWDRVCQYLDDPHRSRIKESSHNPTPDSGWDRTVGGKIALSHVHDDQETLNEILCEEYGVDYPILNTTSRLTRLPETEYAVELMSAYNDVLLDILDEFDHFRGLVTIATQDPQAAAEEIDRIGDEDDIVGIYISTGGPMYPLGDSRYDVIYEAARDHDLAVGYHGHVDAMISDFPRQNQALEKYFSINVLGHPWYQMLTLTSLMENGTMAKFPDLDFVFMEAGLGWVPYMMYRMNKEYSMRRSELPLLEKSPEEYIRDQCYFATQPIDEPNNPAHLAHIVDMLGADSIAFASDYPHWDHDNPAATVDQLKRILEPDEQDLVFKDNAAKAFGMNV
jgi:predicted TIM-barrel fold metal-dependent hydrolase